MKEVIIQAIWRKHLIYTYMKRWSMLLVIREITNDKQSGKHKKHEILAMMQRT